MKKNYTLFAGFIVLLCITCGSVQAQFTNDQSASLVLGQPDFITRAENTTQNGMDAPAGVAVDNSGNLYESEVLNNRVMIFKNVNSKANGANADFVLGQTNFTSDNTSTSVNGLYNPEGVCVDGSGNLYVCDESSNRVLVFKNITAKVNAGTLVNGANADFVLGQTNFTDNSNGTSQNSMHFPVALSIDASGNLYVTDAFNYRVLIFKNVVSKVNAGTLVNGANADFVLGQTNFTTGSAPSSPSQSVMGPDGIVIDGSGNLYVSDVHFNRVIIFKNTVSRVNAGTLANGANADFVLGAPDFTTAGGGTTQNTFYIVLGSGTDASGNFYLCDNLNNRVLIFENMVSKVTDGTLTNGANADIVLGQSSFTSNVSNISAEGFNYPYGLALDASDNLFVSDYENSRILRFSNSLLPVTLTSFAANMPDQFNVNLTWSTATEENTDHFDLMRSVDGVHFNNIASIKAAGNSNTLINYDYHDNLSKLSFAGAIYYQLREVDIDGKIQMSSEVLVKPDVNAPGVGIWPNPFNDHVQLSINAHGSGKNNDFLTINGW
ncbi:MAG TPA: NHL repeat-containing protein [Hanamia sp.]